MRQEGEDDDEIRGELLGVARSMKLRGVDDLDIVDGLLTLGAQAAMRLLGREAALEVLREFVDNLTRGDASGRRGIA